jgi:type III restriction enzyme
MLVREDDSQAFKHALHERYDGLNDLERRFAEGLDRAAAVWARNPSRTGYGIPLISPGTTSSFYPDFLVWDGPNVFALDTTGGHLLKEKTGRKLLSIESAKPTSGRLVVRLVSEGQWNTDVEQEDSAGYTVWGRKQDNSLRVIHVDSVEAAVERSVSKDS